MHGLCGGVEVLEEIRQHWGGGGAQHCEQLWRLGRTCRHWPETWPTCTCFASGRRSPVSCWRTSPQGWEPQERSQGHLLCRSWGRVSSWSGLGRGEGALEGCLPLSSNLFTPEMERQEAPMHGNVRRLVTSFEALLYCRGCVGTSLVGPLWLLLSWAMMVLGHLGHLYSLGEMWIVSDLPRV